MRWAVDLPIIFIFQEDLGQFKRLLDPGLHFLCWPLQNVVGTLSLRIQQLDVYCETKTRDNVFVQVAVAVQYRVLAESAYEAYYRLTDPRTQIQSYVFDVVRSTVPKMELDEAFASKDDIATAVLESLAPVMKEYGMFWHFVGFPKLNKRFSHVRSRPRLCVCQATRFVTPW